MNVVVLTGNLGLDPEIRYLPSGTQTARMRLAVSEYWYDKNTQQKQTRTHWFTVNAFGRQAEVCGQYLRKGSKLMVRGKLEFREWNDREGKKRSVVEVVMQEMEMLGSRENQQERQPQRSTPEPEGDPGFDPSVGAQDEDIPF